MWYMDLFLFKEMPTLRSGAVNNINYKNKVEVVLCKTNAKT